MLSTGLPVSRYVSVQVSLTTPAVIAQAINSCLIVGASDVIDAGERMRRYASISEVARDFGTLAEEFSAAEIWFSQNPRPDNVLIGRWIQAPTGASLLCAIIPPVDEDITLWRAIADGSFSITVGGASQNITGLDFSAETNLNGVASVINTALAAAGATVRWTGQRFIFTTVATGVAATIGFLDAVTPTAGTDIATTLRGTAATADRIVYGQAVETALSAVVAIDELFSSNFYGIVVPGGDDEDQKQIAAYVEAADPVHYLGITTEDTNTLDMIHRQDLASILNEFGYNKTAVQYSTPSRYAVLSYLARILTTQWTGQNTAITLMYKRQPGVPLEHLSTSQADALLDKCCNVYTGVANGANITQYGMSASGEFTDTIIGADALALAIQNALFNSLYTTPTKIPQTDFGMGILVNAASGVCARYVSNGYLGPGTWNAPGVGNISQGDLLPLGFYVFAPSIALQDEGARAARRAPLLQILAKTAGAIHHVDVLIFINQ